MKKKLEDAYNPDSKSRKEKVLLGLSGGIDSLVTAYLLKIQKYDLVAVTVANSWEEGSLDQEKTLSCYLSMAKLEKIKSFCNKMGIPLQVLKTSQEFRESVVEPWMADKAMGRKTNPCWSCHELKMNLLHQKMKEVGATKLATGHYAKLFHHEGHDSVFVHTSNDEIHDQSALLSRLSHDVLNSLILPLSDLTRKEVLKLAENFGVFPEKTSLPFNSCLAPSDELASILQNKIPKKIIEDGEITNLDGSLNLGSHEGVHEHTFGENIEIRGEGKPVKGIFAGYAYSDKRMIVVEPDFIQRSRIMLTKCSFSEEVSWPEPMKGFLVLAPEEIVECWIYPKTLSTVYLEFSEDHKCLPGSILSVLKKKGKNSKVLLTGQVCLLKEEQQDHTDEDTPKVDPVLDF